MLPNDIEKRKTIAAYLKEALAAKAQEAHAKLKLNEVFDSVKNSEDSLQFTLASFKEALTVALDYEKATEKSDKLQAAIEVVDTLRV